MTKVKRKQIERLHHVTSEQDHGTIGSKKILGNKEDSDNAIQELSGAQVQAILPMRITDDSVLEAIIVTGETEDGI